ncbi:VWA domain-containing protein [Lentzea californiensis]|uniref:VWA domain-containing protein n=1 Tax=Lentzea californiensis TaxID=438851 RepID=UPI002165D217|nr:VWA domain-containing protein [Lentzea californiensis]
MHVDEFATPAWFGLLAAVAALAVGYLDRVAPNRPARARHLPAALTLLALTIFTVGLAGPTAEARVPRDRATVMLVLDESLSMGATDAAPSRLDAMKVTATDFVKGLPAHVNLGLVTFAGTATVQVMPTTLCGPTLRESTATGEALAAAFAAQEQIDVLLAGADGPPPSRIVLLPDGRKNAGRKNAGREVDGPADDCRNAGVEIDTISFGTENRGVTINIQGRIYDRIGSQVGYETKQVDASKPWMTLGAALSLTGAALAPAFNQRVP